MTKRTFKMRMKKLFPEDYKLIIKKMETETKRFCFYDDIVSKFDTISGVMLNFVVWEKTSDGHSYWSRLESTASREGL